MTSRDQARITEPTCAHGVPLSQTGCPARLGECENCGHPSHQGICGYALTEEIRDDVGFLAPPTGEVITEIIGTCRCSPPALHVEPPFYPLENRYPQSRAEANGEALWPIRTRTDQRATAHHNQWLLAQARAAVAQCTHVIGTDAVDAIAALLKEGSP